MAQLTDPNGFAVPPSPVAAPPERVALAGAASPDRMADPVAIFSAPDVVFHWWAESKRRWAEENRVRALSARPGARVADKAGPDSD